MTVQEDFDDLYTFSTTISPALQAVNDAWDAVAEDTAIALAAIPPLDEDGDAWKAYLDDLGYTFIADNEPDGLTADQLVVWNDRAGDVEYKARRRIRRRASELVAQNSVTSQHLARSIESLSAAKAMFVARDIWSPEWVMFVVLGVYHGHEAGGVDAFPETPDRQLYGQARTLLVNNAERCLEIFDLSRDQWPSDAAGVAEYRTARNALEAFMNS